MSYPRITNNQAERVSRSVTFSNIKHIFSLGTKAVLDVGCSEGYYLRHFGEGSVGVTIIADHVEIARDHGLNVVLKNVEDSDFSLHKTFDAIWANNFFEHLNAPHSFLMRMRDHSSQDGILILGVPVIPYFSWLTYFKKFRGAYAVSHVNFFTRNTLIETVKAAGWLVIQARPFYVKNTIIDSVFNLIAPHIYVIAIPKKDFVYPQKRLMSLEGYN